MELIYPVFYLNRSTPVESLHTILLGPYKYLLKSTIPTLSRGQKEEVLARVRAFNYSGFRVRLFGNVIHHHQSFVGRDYKAWAQMALFIIYPYLKNEDKTVWLALSKVNNLKAHLGVYLLFLVFRFLRLPTVTTTTHLRLLSGTISVNSLWMLLVSIGERC